PIRIANLHKPEFGLVSRHDTVRGFNAHSLGELTEVFIFGCFRGGYMPAPDVLTLVKSEFFEPANKLLEKNHELLTDLHWHDKHGEHLVTKAWKNACKIIAREEKKFNPDADENTLPLKKISNELVALYNSSREYFASMGADTEAYTHMHRNFEHRAQEVFEQIDRVQGKRDGKVIAGMGEKNWTTAITDTLILGSIKIQIKIINQYVPGSAIGQESVAGLSPDIMEKMSAIILNLFMTALRNMKNVLPSSFNLDVKLKPLQGYSAALMSHSNPRYAFIEFALTPSILEAAKQNMATPKDPAIYNTILHELAHFVDWRLIGVEHFKPEMHEQMLITLRGLLHDEPTIPVLNLASTIDLARTEAYAIQSSFVDAIKKTPQLRIPEIIPKLEQVQRDLRKVFQEFKAPLYNDYLQQIRHGGEAHEFGHYMLVLSWLHRLLVDKLAKTYLLKRESYVSIVPSGVGTQINDALFVFDQQALDNIEQDLQKVRLNDWPVFLANFAEACKFFGIKNIASIEQLKKVQLETKKVFSEQAMIRTAA
ncbi:hypothetical protein GOV10_04955, partial [Candidatus Woesearchaeota archaeon]|nr:hypothetical protein [Candidatus Woesearchaeota archaeon]